MGNGLPLVAGTSSSAGGMDVVSGSGLARRGLLAPDGSRLGVADALIGREVLDPCNACTPDSEASMVAGMLGSADGSAMGVEPAMVRRGLLALDASTEDVEPAMVEREVLDPRDGAPMGVEGSPVAGMLFALDDRGLGSERLPAEREVFLTVISSVPQTR
jgi:hypothetical protein